MNLISIGSQVFDIDEIKGQYGYVANFMNNNGSDSNLMSCLAKLFNKAKEQEKTLYWLLQLRRSINREGWEETPTEKQVLDNILDFLANRELDPGIEKENIDKFIKDFEEKTDNLF